MRQVECLRVGITEVTVTKGPGFGGPDWIAKLKPVVLKASKRVRVDRLYEGSQYLEEPKVLQLAMTKKDDPPSFLVQALRDLIPVED